MVLQHILDEIEQVEVEFLVDEHLTRLHFPLVSTFHTHDGPDGIVCGCLPVIRGSPKSKPFIVWCVKHVLWIASGDGV